MAIVKKPNPRGHAGSGHPARLRWQARRRAVIDAAERVFRHGGITGLTVRAVAAEAGYTPGALYSYVAGKDDLLAEVAGQSLNRLAQTLKEALGGEPETLLARRIDRFRTHYRRHPADLDLLAHLLASGRMQALDPTVERHLTGRLIVALGALAEALVGTRALNPEVANRDTLALAAFLLGLSLLENSGRLAVLGFPAEALIESYLGRPRG